MVRTSRTSTRMVSHEFGELTMRRWLLYVSIQALIRMKRMSKQFKTSRATTQPKLHELGELTARLWHTHNEQMWDGNGGYGENLTKRTTKWQYGMNEKTSKRPRDLLVLTKGPKSSYARRCIKYEHNNQQVQYIMHLLNDHQCLKL